MLNLILIAIALLAGAVLLSKRIRDDTTWRATVTPLASIIGSGFLVIVPLLGNAVGSYAPLAMVAVVLLAYCIGTAIRFNIRYAEPTFKGSEKSVFARLDTVAGLFLGLAYVVSVTFYLRLLSSFALHGLGLESVLLAKTLTTAILVCIGVAGWVWGLTFLERLEEYSVSIKLAIIVSMLVGWATYDVSIIHDLDDTVLFVGELELWHVARILAGVLIVVQGFETSRYLGMEYDAETRIRTMRRAQIASGTIYILFVLFTVPAFHLLGAEVNETAIIDLSKIVAPVLAPMLVVAAIMSQLSAAVADTVGAGGLFLETIGTRFKLHARVGYALVAVVGVVLVWTADIFEIISLASRAFALYYALQCLVAAGVAAHRFCGAKRFLLVVAFGSLAALLLVAAAIAIPAG